MGAVSLLETLREDGIGGGVGLAGMTERVREIGGSLDINSSSSGTEIVVKVPIRARVQDRISPGQPQEVGG